MMTLKFNASVGDNPSFNFMLLPSNENGHLQVLHCVSIFEDQSEETLSLIGVFGTRFNSPWKVIDRDSLTVPLKKPSRRSPLLSIPSPRDLLECSWREERDELRSVEFTSWCFVKE